MEDIAIKVQNVCIDYRGIRHMSIHQSLFGRKNPKNEEVFHAIKDVSFEVHKGKILGMVGRNGSGKSTLLRSIAGIFQPDSGSIETNGNRVSLMAIGVGFKPDISGRENIISSGMLMGFDERYVMSKLDEIIEFSELKDFIEKPVRTYSSGMYSKLSFAVTSILKTDILLIDEVLSVGDEHFKKKSYDKMNELIMDGEKTVLIVSHSLEMLKGLCNEVLWLDDGKVKMKGCPIDVISEYRKYMLK